jgi:hypothetical protein
MNVPRLMASLSRTGCMPCIGCCGIVTSPGEFRSGIGADNLIDQDVRLCALVLVDGRRISARLTA